MAARPGERPSGLPRDKIYKLVLLGENVERQRSFGLEYTSTIGCEILTQMVKLDDTTVKFQVWDMATHERFHNLVVSYYRGAQAAIVVYDVTNQDTFARAKMWIKELQHRTSPNIVIALAGNKANMTSKRMVEYDEAQSYAEENSLLFMETSAKTVMNVNEILLAIAKKLPAASIQGTATGQQCRDIDITHESSSQRRCWKK